MHGYARQTAAQSWYAVSRLGAIIVGALLAGLAGAMAGFVIAPLIAALATLGGLQLLRRDRDGSAAAQAAPPSVTRRRLLREAGPLVLVAGLITLLLTLDLLAFKRVGTAADAGRYAAAATIAHVPFFLLRSASIILMPAVAAAAMAGSSRDPRSPRVQAEIRHGIGDAIVLLALPTALLITLGDRALDLIFGERYAVNGLVVAPLAIATAAITLYSVFVAVEIALGRLRIAVATGALGCRARDGGRAARRPGLERLAGRLGRGRRGRLRRARAHRDALGPHRPVRRGALARGRSRSRPWSPRRRSSRPRASCGS